MKRANQLVVALAIVLALGAVASGDVTGPHPGIETSPVTPPQRGGVIVQEPQRGGVIIQGPQRGGGHRRRAAARDRDVAEAATVETG